MGANAVQGGTVGIHRFPDSVGPRRRPLRPVRVRAPHSHRGLMLCDVGKGEPMSFIGSKSEFQAEIGRRISQARERAGLTKLQLAALSDISITTLMHIENGARGIKVTNLFKIAKAVDVPPFNLMPDDWQEATMPQVRRVVDEVTNPKAVNGDDGDDDGNGTNGGSNPG